MRSLKRKLIIFLVLWSLIAIIIFSNFLQTSHERNRMNLRTAIEASINSMENRKQCRIPHLPVINREITKHYRNRSKIDCAKDHDLWVDCEGTVCNIRSSAIRAYGNIKCNLSEIIRSPNGTSIYNGRNTTVTNSISGILVESDFAVANCISTRTRKKWKGIVAGIVVKKDMKKQLSSSVNYGKFNILVLGVTSISRNHFIRKLPKTYGFLQNQLQAGILKGYNVVGDGKIQALLPIFTGKTELELPDVRKRIADSATIDDFSFLWNNYKSAGYVTAFNEDSTLYPAFGFRLKAFDSQPYHHSLFDTYALKRQIYRNKYGLLCFGPISEHRFFLEYIQKFTDAYKSYPKFSFNFLSTLSENFINSIGRADDDFLDFLKWLQTSDAINNTILIVLTDHGTQFEDIRNVLQGKLEERLPFCAFAFPNRFRAEFPKEFENFAGNLNKLTTPFDIYETLVDILRIQNNIEPKAENEKLSRGISLFRKIPEIRTCAEAAIQPQWCSCSPWQDMTKQFINPALFNLPENLVNSVIEKINDFTKSKRKNCEQFKLERIVWIRKIIFRDKLLKFKQSLGIDKFYTEFSNDYPKIKQDFYNLKFIIQPGKFIYQADVSYDLDERTIDVDLNDIPFEMINFCNNTKDFKLL